MNKKILTIGSLIVIFSLLFSLALPMSPVGAASQAYTWKNVQIVGGGFTPGIVFNQTEPDLIYARMDIGGLYRWDPSDNKWIPLLDWIGWDDWNLTGVASVATDPVDPDRVYAAVGTYTNYWTDQNGAILRSTNRGNTWERTDLSFKLGANMPGRSMGERLAIDPNKNSILYLGAPDNNGLWKSTDYGVTWTKVESFPNPGDYCQNPDDPWDYLNHMEGVVWVTFDPTTGTPGNATQTIYVGVADKDNTCIYRTTDGGSNWELVPGQPTTFSCPHHGVLSSTGILYITYGNTSGPYNGTLGDVWKYNTATGVWTRISPWPSDDPEELYFGYGGLSVDAQNPDTIMVSSFTSWWPDCIIWRSLDGGTTWSKIWEWERYPNRSFKYIQDVSAAPWLDDYEPGPRDPVVSPKLGWMVGDMEIDPFNSDRFMYVTGATIYGSNNLTVWDTYEETGAQFTIEVMAVGVEETAVARLLSPPEGAPLVSGLYDIGGFRHDNLDVVPNVHFPAPGAHDIDYAELSPNKMFCAGKLAYVDPEATPPEEIKHAMYSTDGASTWTHVANDITGITGYGGGGTVAVAADGSRVLWAPEVDPEGDYAVPVSYSDWGTFRRWTESTGIPPQARVASDRVNPKKFYGFKDGKFYVSTDGGATFSQTAATGLPSTGTCWIKAVPGREGDIWLAGGSTDDVYGLWHSTDSGASFTKLANVQEADTIGFGKAAPGQSYMALYTNAKIDGVRGIYRSDDAGATWVRINDDLHQYGCANRDITGDPRIYGRVYIGTNGRGIIYGDPAG